MQEKHEKKFRQRHKLIHFLLMACLIYLCSYFVLRYFWVMGKRSFDNEGRDNFVYGSLFNANNILDKTLAYIYLPLGLLDYSITGHLYWLSENTYTYYSLNSNVIKAYIADKNNKNNEVFYSIVFDDGSKSSGCLGCVKEPYDVLQLVMKSCIMKGRSGVCEVKIETLTGLEGKATMTHGIEFKNGIVNGLYITSFNNQMVSKVRYKDGLRDGESISWVNGREILKGQFDKNKHTGQWVFTYIDRNTVFCKANFRDGKLDGILDVYDIDGNLFAEGVYRNGEPYDGTFISKMNEFLFVFQFNARAGIGVDLLSYKSGKLISSKKMNLICTQFTNN